MTKKHWDIKKPYKTRITKKRKQIPIYPQPVPIGPVVIAPHPDVCQPNEIPCLHKNCPGCKSGYCSGVHMISCPCPSCTPRMSIGTSPLVETIGTTPHYLRNSSEVLV